MNQLINDVKQILEAPTEGMRLKIELGTTNLDEHHELTSILMEARRNYPRMEVNFDQGDLTITTPAVRWSHNSPNWVGKIMQSEAKILLATDHPWPLGYEKVQLTFKPTLAEFQDICHQTRLSGLSDNFVITLDANIITIYDGRKL
jgi:hypothetical protein